MKMFSLFSFITAHSKSAKIKQTAFLLAPLILAGCGGLFSKAGSEFAQNLAGAVADYEDPQIVQAGSSSYLLLTDALIKQYPENSGIKLAAANLNSSYAGAFVKEPKRLDILSSKAFNYAQEAVCLEHKTLCKVQTQSIEDLQRNLSFIKKDDVAQLFTLGSTWAGWIQAHTEDFNAVADLPRVEAVMKRVIALDETYQHGMAYLYMGVIATSIPPALGGRPEEGKAYFEKAIALSEGHNLMAKVYFAKNYARGVYNRELHDLLLNEVLASEGKWPGWTLANQLAKQEAEALLKSADDFF